MIRIYCQYTVAGFKIFNLMALPHTMEGGRYARMNEIAEGVEGKEQNIFVTRNCDCGLDKRIMTYFSQRSVGMMLLRNCGPKTDETILFVDDLDSQTAYAFATKEPSDEVFLLQMAVAWNSDKKKELVRRLQALVGKPAIDQETVFAFYENQWNDLVNDLRNMKMPMGKLALVQKFNTNMIMYLAPNIRTILQQAGIQKSVCSFITLPGNEEMKLARRKRNLIIAAVIAIIIGLIIIF